VPGPAARPDRARIQAVRGAPGRGASVHGRENPSDVQRQLVGAVMPSVVHSLTSAAVSQTEEYGV